MIVHKDLPTDLVYKMAKVFGIIIVSSIKVKRLEKSFDKRCC